MIKVNADTGSDLLSRSEILGILKSGKAQIERLMSQQDIVGAENVYESMAEKLRPLVALIEGITISRPEERRKFQTVKSKLSSLRHKTAPGYIKIWLDKADDADAQDRAMRYALEGLSEAVLGFVPYLERIKGYQKLESTFTHKQFTVINKYGFRSEEYAPILQVFDKAAEAIAAAGFGAVLYGKLFLVGEKEAQSGPIKNWCGLYEGAPDVFSLNVECVYRFSREHTIIHELGHRHWFKFLTEAEREAYEDLYSGTAKVSISLADREAMWVALESADFNVRAVPKYLDPKLLDSFRVFWKERMKGLNVTRVISEIRAVKDPSQRPPNMSMDMVKRQFILPSKRWYFIEKDMPQSVTDYGRSSVREDYAEVFAFHVQKKPLTEDARLRFFQANFPAASLVAKIARRFLTRSFA